MRFAHPDESTLRIQGVATMATNINHECLLDAAEDGETTHPVNQEDYLAYVACVEAERLGYLQVGEAKLCALESGFSRSGR